MLIEGRRSMDYRHVKLPSQNQSSLTAAARKAASFTNPILSCRYPMGFPQASFVFLHALTFLHISSFPHLDLFAFAV